MSALLNILNTSEIYKKREDHDKFINYFCEELKQYGIQHAINILKISKLFSPNNYNKNHILLKNKINKILKEKIAENPAIQQFHDKISIIFELDSRLQKNLKEIDEKFQSLNN